MRKLRYNGAVTSMDGSMNRYEAIGTQDGKIVFVDFGDTLEQVVG